MKTFAQQAFFALALVVGFSQVASAVTFFNITPSAVSNTYSGTVTLHVSGLTPGDTVVVQQFLDLNSNGVIDPTDFLMQQFDLTDGQAGMVIGGVTNINVPGDTDTTAGQITALANFVSGGAGPIAGQYVIRVSSPTAQFTPLTQLFLITNVSYPQKITGKVVSNGTNVPDAVVVIFPPASGNHNGPGNPVAWAAADNSGSYSIPVPVGMYIPLAFKNGYVANYGNSPLLTVGSSQTINANLTLTNATTSISGSVVDISSNSVGLPGIFLPLTANDGLIAVGFSDTNGNFNIPVRADQWELDGGPSGLAIHGYVGYQGKTNIDTSGGSVSGLIMGFSKATAVFYGHVKDNLGIPIPSVHIFSGDGNNEYGADAYTDKNGYYVATALGGLGSDTWSVQIDNNQVVSTTNYIFSQGDYGVTLGVGQAIPYNFTALLATNRITGNVQYNGSPVSGVQVYAYATIGTNNFQSQTDTDTNGNYSLNVANGTWYVSLYDCGCSDSDSLNNLITGSYLDPSSQSVSINGNNGAANFTVLPNNGSSQIFGYVKDASNNPVANLSVYIGDSVGHIYSTNTDSFGYYSFLVASGGWGITLNCGQLNSLGYQCVGTNFFYVSGYFQQDFTLQSAVAAAPTISSPARLSGGQFQMLLNGVANQNYTLQTSTNLSSTNWVTLFTTNNPATNSFLLAAPNATNKQRFYRVLVGP